MKNPLTLLPERLPGFQTLCDFPTFPGYPLHFIASIPDVIYDHSQGKCYGYSGHLLRASWYFNANTHGNTLRRVAQHFAGSPEIRCGISLIYWKALRGLLGPFTGIPLPVPGEISWLGRGKGEGLRLNIVTMMQRMMMIFLHLSSNFHENCIKM